MFSSRKGFWVVTWCLMFFFLKKKIIKFKLGFCRRFFGQVLWVGSVCEPFWSGNWVHHSSFHKHDVSFIRCYKMQLLLFLLYDVYEKCANWVFWVVDQSGQSKGLIVIIVAGGKIHAKWTAIGTWFHMVFRKLSSPKFQISMSCGGSLL